MNFHFEAVSQQRGKELTDIAFKEFDRDQAKIDKRTKIFNFLTGGFYSFYMDGFIPELEGRMVYFYRRLNAEREVKEFELQEGVYPLN